MLGRRVECLRARPPGTEPSLELMGSVFSGVPPCREPLKSLPGDLAFPASSSVKVQSPAAVRHRPDPEQRIGMGGWEE